MTGGLGGLDAITFDCGDPLRLARFWGAVFGADVAAVDGDEPHYVDLVPVPGLPTLRFQRVPEPKTTKNRLHLDVSVEDLEEACGRVEALGGRRISARPYVEYGYEWLVMADLEGNEFCLVIDREA
ncbi:MAG TPA: VOC family protein [Actinomycetota bacterium]|nr:VOC family protein [Actinomycetota bacterium]